MKTQIPLLAYQNGKNLIDCQHTIGKAVGNKQSQSISIAYNNAKLETASGGNLGIATPVPFDLAITLWECLLQIHLNLYKIIYV